ncbi:hypothetical protein [Beggiatoa leptomitoformis]|uniref:Tetratricopeptide repeat protein n=1 Tax=Beggiatoa leptomitoformis TaxID=288004 RepID=A0A2N9YAR8_9GAMM|nr:hypothetical protein [Beggiatoa leptomitoformis]ALG67070.1 hypothetical protein AL038_04250 [Beggiatoa leptomitoformis]AUI67542.1 hypothetical protein BLE401_01755 [Beggiatoa leptomitoformis]
MKLLQAFSLKALLFGLLFFSLIIGCALLFLPYLNGILIFDDYANLHTLKDFDENNFWLKLGQFITEGAAGELGRPLSLLSFALQYHSWPQVEPFKYINLMLHLLNGCLVFWVLVLLSRFFALTPVRCSLLIFLVTAIWLLHPIQVSTTLYIVQRMAQLSTLFILVGIIFYLKGRYLLAENRLKLGFFLVTAGVIGGGILAAFSKENGVLLVFYIFVLEATLLQKLKTPLYWRYWKTLFIDLPCFAVVGYLFLSLGLGKFQAGYASLGIDVSERLLTQSRVLVDYMGQILLVRPDQYGLAHDDYLPSHGLLTPPITLFTTIFILALFGLACWFRKIYPLFAFSVLWFFAGHVLESSFVPLMLYFEHRNYLPLVGVGVGMVYGLFWLYDRLKQDNLQWIVVTSSIAWLFFMVYLCWIQATIWAAPLYQAGLLAEKHPYSPMAQSHAASVYFNQGLSEQGEQVYQNMIERFPDETGPMMLLYGKRCFGNGKHQVELEDLYKKLQTAVVDSATIAALNSIILEQANGGCELIPVQSVENMLTYLLANPRVGQQKRNIYVLQALSYGYNEQYESALNSISQAILLKDVTPVFHFWRVAWLLKLNRVTEAQQVFTTILQTFTPLQQTLYKDDIAFWKKQLAEHK